MSYIIKYIQLENIFINLQYNIYRIDFVIKYIYISIFLYIRHFKISYKMNNYI